MKKVTELNHYEILDLKPTATKADIQNSFNRLWRTYQPDSLAVYSILSGQEREEMLARIEDAYHVLMDEIKRHEYDKSIGIRTFDVKQKPKTCETIFEAIEALEDMNKKTPDENPIQEEPLDPLKHDFLKSYREQKGISLREISETTNISISMLSALETGEYDKLPGRTYVIGFLKEYVKYIGLDYQQAKQNMEKWYQWGKSNY